MKRIRSVPGNRTCPVSNSAMMQPTDQMSTVGGETWPMNGSDSYSSVIYPGFPPEATFRHHYTSHKRLKMHFEVASSPGFKNTLRRKDWGRSYVYFEAPLHIADASIHCILDL